MDNYQLVVPAAHESIDDDDDDDDDRRHGEPSYSDKSRPLTTRNDPPSTPRRRRYHSRTDSRGSYSSILSDSDSRRYGDGESTTTDHATTEDDTRPAVFYLDDGEKSPLHRSYEDTEEEEENCQAAPSTGTRPGAYPPNRTMASILFGSDDSDDDDDDEYEEHLKRYALDFRQSSSLSNTNNSNNNNNNNNNNSHNNNNNSYSLWSKMQQARQKARQRRTEYLLEQSERRSWKQSLYLFLVTTLCDATDGGIALIAIGLLAWFILVWKLPEHRSLIVWSGLVVWSIRFGARPARYYWIQRRIRLYQQQQQEQWRHYSGGGEFRQDGTVPDTPPPLSLPPTVNRFEDTTRTTPTTSRSIGGAFFPLAMPSSMELSAV